MSRKDFVLIATMLHQAKAKRALIESFAVALANTNSNFDKGRFIRACLTGEGLPGQGGVVTL